MKELISPTGEKHGLINAVANSVQDNEFKHMKPDAKKKAEALKKEEQKIIRARYINRRGKNERLRMPYCRWAGEPIQTWNFIPEEEYEVPYGLVKQVNSNKGLAKRSDLCDANGVPMLKDDGYERIHEFVPVSF